MADLTPVEHHQILKRVPYDKQEIVRGLTEQLKANPLLQKKLVRNPFSVKEVRSLQDGNVGMLDDVNIARVIVMAEPEAEYEERIRELSHKEERDELLNQIDISADVTIRLVSYAEVHMDELWSKPDSDLYDELTKVAFLTDDYDKIQRNYSQIQRREFRLAIVNFIEDREKLRPHKNDFEKDPKAKVAVLFKDRLNGNVFTGDIENYFQLFNQAIRKTDILWTKPSEISFYTALGLPIIVAPTIGSQEEFNKRWLLKSGFGLYQESPSYTNQWLFDWLENGYLAKAAMQGFIEAEKLGTFNIQKIISSF